MIKIESIQIDNDAAGDRMYSLAKQLFPICRSITGEGVRKTLDILKSKIDGLRIHSIPTGTNCFDWTIPVEWNVCEAYIANLEGEKVVDFTRNNLHLVGYSEPVDRIVDFKELEQHLHSRSDMPDAIPYTTSYYKRGWGFCLTHNQRVAMNDEFYKVKIDSKLEEGCLNYADILIPGKTSEEILISTYICHPSMGNNETSGMVVATELANFVSRMSERHYSYRFVFVPETVGAVAYISRNLVELKRNVVAGFVITCVGDDKSYSFLPSRKGNSLADRVAKHLMDRVIDQNFICYSFLDRGSDERQYCAPGIDLPVVSLMRSKYGTFPEYHTSRDDLNFISPKGLFGGYYINKLSIECLEANQLLQSTVLCEAFLSPRGLRPPLVDGTKLADWSKMISDVLAYADGELDLIAMAELFNKSILDMLPVVETLKKHGLLKDLR